MVFIVNIKVVILTSFNIMKSTQKKDKRALMVSREIIFVYEK